MITWTIRYMLNGEEVIVTFERQATLSTAYAYARTLIPEGVQIWEFWRDSWLEEAPDVPNP